MTAYQIGLIVQGCISVMAVAGVFVISGLTGMFSLGQAAYLCIGSYCTFMFYRYLSIPLVLSAIVATAICGLFAWGVGSLTLKLRKDYFTLMTVAMGQAVPVLVIVFKKWTNGAYGFSKIPKVDGLLWIALVLTVLIIFCVRNYKYSRFGRMSIALKNDELAAKSFGIDVFKQKMKSYVLSALIGSIAGVILALRGRYIDNVMFSWSYSAEMQIFMFFGGSNSLTGAVFSAAFLKVFPSLLRGVTIFGKSLEEFRTMIYCVLVLIIINFRPQGLLGENELHDLAFFKKIFGKKNKVKEQKEASNE